MTKLTEGADRETSIAPADGEALAERLLVLRRLGESQQKRIAQHVPIRKADIGDRPHRIDAFGGRNSHPGSASRPKEAMKVLSHA